MNWSFYWRDRAVPVLLLFFGFILMGGYLSFLAVSPLQLLPAAIIYFGGIAVYEMLGYRKRRRYFKRMADEFLQIKEKYLFFQMWDGAEDYEDLAYVCLLKECGRAMFEKVQETGQELADYREWMETWVHDMKQPVAAMKLIAEREKTREGRAALLELEKMDHLLEQVLYLARSEEVYRDFLVKETDLLDVVRESFASNKQLLIQSGMEIRLPERIPAVIADEKALLFIISQLIRNTVQYKADRNGILEIAAEVHGERLYFKVCDNGCGIKAEELPRIFEKGFTGTNGRTNRRATGMGLYLCKKLCSRMDVEMWAESEEEKGTAVMLSLKLSKT